MVILSFIGNSGGFCRPLQKQNALQQNKIRSAAKEKSRHENNDDDDKKVEDEVFDEDELKDLDELNELVRMSLPGNKFCSPKKRKQSTDNTYQKRRRQCCSI